MELQSRCVRWSQAPGITRLHANFTASQLYPRMTALSAWLRRLCSARWIWSLPEATLLSFMWLMASWLAFVSMWLRMTIGLLASLSRQLTLSAGLRCDKVAAAPVSDTAASASAAVVTAALLGEPDVTDSNQATQVPHAAAAAAAAHDTDQLSDSKLVLPAPEVAPPALANPTNVATKPAHQDFASLPAAKDAAGKRLHARRAAIREPPPQAAAKPQQRSMTDLLVKTQLRSVAGELRSMPGTLVPPNSITAAASNRGSSPVRSPVSGPAHVGVQQDAAPADASGLCWAQPGAPAEAETHIMHKSVHMSCHLHEADARMRQAPAAALTLDQQRAELQLKAQTRVQAAQAALQLSADASCDHTPAEQHSTASSGREAQAALQSVTGKQQAAAASPSAPREVTQVPAVQLLLGEQSAGVPPAAQPAASLDAPPRCNASIPDAAHSYVRGQAAAQHHSPAVSMTAPRGSADDTRKTAATPASRLCHGTGADAGGHASAVQYSSTVWANAHQQAASAAPEGLPAALPSAPCSRDAQPAADCGWLGRQAATLVPDEAAHLPAAVSSPPRAIKACSRSPVSASSAAASCSATHSTCRSPLFVTPANCSRPCSATMSQLVAGQHWMDTALPDGRSVRRNSRGEAWYNVEAVIRIDQTEFQRLHARLQPSTASPLHDPFWQPTSPAAQTGGSTTDEPSWRDHLRQQAGRMPAVATNKTSGWLAAVHSLAS